MPPVLHLLFFKEYDLIHCILIKGKITEVKKHKA